ncbi:efflux transporter periplasmic adaptor subunit [Vibrio sp. UCD-FRSSP16_10]|uniref:efflux RND transporter periplasmic adaptor subunit n=1 Tax=unclassified Vibrio TaxID=2614977 RepID=UPI000800C55F|nr:MULTISPECIES: efflux RND transporter periplasmic adaptor subunit [unclassified Vibrio]OBT13887.1 efflux transporter periplasmic adaptor subunit [Vibrio sp. UCD-FRSSP16_30]OBT22768.1 efflux transporter periplasmic adaptor subunit [Vibrio sp. UCD-FRSSP16_10]
MRTHGLAVLVAALSLTGCGTKEDVVSEPESRPAKFLTVSVGEKSFERIFPASSSAGDRAVLAFRVPGELSSLPVKAGVMVKKGDVLAILDDKEYKLLRSQAKAHFDLATVQFNRSKKLIKDKVVSEQEYDQARAKHKSARANYDQALANYSYTKLTAPFDGTISLINIDNFEYVDAKQGVMNIQSNDLLKIIFPLPESILTRFRGYDAVKSYMVFDSFPEHKFPVTFQEIDTESDHSTGSYKVTMIMERPQDLGILPGMSGHIHVTLPRIKPSKLPQTSLFSCANQQCVWRVKEDFTVEQVSVSLSSEGQVTSGLKDGDEIVLSGVKELKSGMKVREWIKERGL